MVEKTRRLWRRWAQRAGGALLFLLAIGTTVFTAATASREDPPSSELSVLLVLLAGAFQVGSIALFSRSGRPDDTHSEASVRRLVNLTYRTQALSVSAQDAKSMDTATMRSALLDLSARLNYIAEDTLASVEDWTSFNSAAERKVNELNQNARQQRGQNESFDEENINATD